ncbi:MAG: polysaccharide biosynthesis protein [Fimbriimonadaceae bacterium]|nr:polysaccharide biosynthesis protein [Chitinophagales bacterium]
MVTIFTYCVAYILRYNFRTDEIHFNIFVRDLTLITTLYTITFILFKSYEGIIRHSGVADTIKLVRAGIAASVFTILVSTLSKYFSPEVHVLPASIAIIHFILNIVLLALSRYGIKVLFYQSGKQSMLPTLSVIIYGADRGGVNTLRALKEDMFKNYKVCAFIDDDKEKINKYLEGVKVYPVSKISNLVKNFRITECIIAEPHLSHDIKNIVVERCLANKVSVKHLPPMEDWINGKLTAHQIRNMRIEDLLERELIHIHSGNINDEISGKIILITGAAGSIGSELVRQVIYHKPKKLILLDQAESGLYDLQTELWLMMQLMEEHVVETIICDITQRHRLQHVFETYKPEIVFHAAAYKHVPLMETNPLEAVHVNVLGTKNLVDLSVENKVNKFIFISTDKAVNPTNVMGATKRAAEIYVKDMSDRYPSTKFVTTRFGNVLGSSGSVIPLFKKQIENGGPVTITHPEVTRYFMTISEACQLVLQASSLGNGGEIYLFDMGESVKIYDLARKMVLLSGLMPDKDIEFIFTGLRSGEKLHEELLNDRENTLPTPHPKIMVANATTYDSAFVEYVFDKFQHSMIEPDQFKVVAVLKEFIPEFISRNSAFTGLDNETRFFNISDK